MELWITLSIAAAAFQTLRFMLQKHLSMGALSVGGATLARFVYAAPFIFVLALAYLTFSGAGMPSHAPVFWVYAVTGGIAQILATWCVVPNFFGCRPWCKRFLTISVRVIDCVLLSGLFSAALSEAAAGMVISGSGPNLRQGLEGRS